jgi:hypothetical protein
MQTNDNENDTPIGAVAYYRFLVEYLRERKFIAADDLKNVILEKFGSAMQPADYERLKGRKTLVWENLVDHAKAQGARRGTLATVSVKVGRKRKQFVVLTDRKDTFTNLLFLAARKCRGAGGFNKSCDNCGTYNALAADVCQRCGIEFPAATQKRDVTVSV